MQLSRVLYTYAGCSGDLLYEFSSGKCVETCSQCAISVAGSCQSFAKIGMCKIY